MQNPDPGKDAAEAIKKRSRLPERSSMPQVKDLLLLLSETEKLRGRLIEVPWREQDISEPLVLTVEFEPGATLPVWSLYQGEGPNSQLVWSCRETDMYLLYDLLCMFMSQLKPKATQPAAQLVEETPETGAAGGFFQAISPVDLELLKEQPNVLLGHLLVEAGFIPEPLLDAALKVQEMVRNQSLTPEQAVDALRRAYARAGAEPAAPEPKEEGKPRRQPEAQAEKRSEAAPTRPDNSEARHVCAFLQQAGIILAEDVEAASRLKRKPGEELELLLAAGKIDKLTHEAALTSWRMIRDQMLKPEQGIIALHYCQRMRVSLREAFTEMGWEYPV